MTNKQRVHQSLLGAPVDRFPITALYNHLVYEDHFAELTGEPQWRLHAWQHASPEEHLRVYKRMVERAPFELLQPRSAPSRELRERLEFVERDGRPFQHDRQTGEWTPVSAATRSGHATDNTANERRLVHDKADVVEHVHVTSAEQAIASGANDYLEAVVAELGETEFILSGGVTGALWCCHSYVGLTNLLAMLVEEANFVEYLIPKVLEQNFEEIRRLATAGGDAIFLDDALATNDMISVAQYERFCWPYTKAMIDEVHRLGQQAIVIYYGGVADRLEQIAALGADGLVVETSMKGYVNDIEEIVGTIGERVTVFGNIDPVGVVQNGGEEELDTEIRRQCRAGAAGRGFVVAVASPLTPATSVTRMRTFVELGKQVGEEVIREGGRETV